MRCRGIRTLVSAVSGVAVLGLLLAVPTSAGAQPRCEAPQVLLVVDKSSSMTHELPSGITKWTAARMALGEITAAYEDGIDFGLQLFPYAPGGEAGMCAPGQITVHVGPNSSSTLLSAMGNPPPTGGNYTPMAQTLAVTSEYMPLRNSARSNHVILIGDGWQWCDPYDPATRFTPVAAVEDLRDLGITVHVVGFGASVDALTLNRAAVAAGTALPGCNPMNDEPSDPNQCYMQANDLSELRIALENTARDITGEMCDGFDNDCNGQIDEGFDRDGDGFTTCGTDWDEPGRTDQGLRDCDDNDPDVYPGADEVCDGVDNDCDGRIDTDCGCQEGDTQDCGSDIGVCMSGTQTCRGGRWGGCEGAVAPAARESCDGSDEDCDERVDEGADCGSGRRCMDGRCVDIMPPRDEPEPEPEPEDMMPAEVAPAGAQDGGCCAIGGVDRPATGRGALALAALLAAALVWRRRRC